LGSEHWTGLFRLTFDQLPGGTAVNRLRMVCAVIAVMLPLNAFAQRTPRTGRMPSTDLQRAVDVIQEWGKMRAAEGTRACQLQAVLNELIEVDRAMDPMQPNVSIAKANDHLAAAEKIAPKGYDTIPFRIEALLITARQILEPHLTPDIPTQHERFAREVLEPAYRLVTPEVIAFVEMAQSLDVALRAVSQTQSDMSALILHAIHGDCERPQR
jgi:hypothetical protein